MKRETHTEPNQISKLVLLQERFDHLLLLADHPTMVDLRGWHYDPFDSGLRPIAMPLSALFRLIF